MKKRNNGGKLQNYIEKGNGEKSGEYTYDDNFETVSNLNSEQRKLIKELILKNPNVKISLNNVHSIFRDYDGKIV